MKSVFTSGKGVGAVVGALTLTALPAFAHFPWVLNDKGVARVILSETLKLDYGVESDIVAPVTLSFRAADGQTRGLPVRKAGPDYVVDVPQNGTVFGKLDLGVNKRGDTAHILVYFPKAIVGNPFGKESQTIGAPVELNVVETGGAARLKLLADGKPLVDTEVTVVQPDDSQIKMKTDAQGMTAPIVRAGRYGAWARHWVPEKGDRGGVAYEEVRRYATLVFDNPAPAAAMAESGGAAVKAAGRLPEATSSFGAVTDAGWLYVYGGHIVPTHDYSKTSVSGAFHRLNVATGAWESLPDGPTVQGMNLAVHDGRIFRVGGMRPDNDPGKPSDIHSLSEAAAFNPKTGKWEPLPSLRTPRSSHDLAVVGDKLFVLGGWDMEGKTSSVWSETMEVLDLKKTPLAWQTMPQPFKRRALIAAVKGGSIYVLGGFDPDDKVLDAVDIYNVARNEWTKGPALPKGTRNGFSPAASTLDDHVFISLGDGSLYRLNDAGSAWEKVSTTTPRIAHRMIAVPGRLFLLGGATNGDNLDLIESVEIAPPASARAGLK